MKKTLKIIIIAVIIVIIGLAVYYILSLNRNLNDTTLNDANQIGIANPSSVYCAELGYDSKIAENSEGQYGICVFPDKTECEEWAFYRGECGEQWVNNSA